MDTVIYGLKLGLGLALTPFVLVLTLALVGTVVGRVWRRVARARALRRGTKCRALSMSGRRCDRYAWHEGLHQYRLDAKNPCIVVGFTSPDAIARHTLLQEVEP